MLTLQNSEVVRIMNEESFDLVILGYAMNEFLLGFGAHFNCPIIVMFANGHIKPLNDLVGNPTGNSYIPHILLGWNGPMTFLKRIENTILNIKMELRFAYFNNRNRKAYNLYFQKLKSYPSFDEIKKNVSLVFVTSHFTHGVLRPNQPNIIEIGGIKAMDNKQQLLSRDIQEFLDSAKNGAIFMSLGTNFNSSSLPTEKLKSILNSFKKIKQKVLWKWENETLEGKPDNIKISKWFPQDEILSHPNMKLFITHGGLGSITEAKFHGVPVLGIPISMDQPTNLKVIENEGWAVIVNFEDLNEVSLTEGINEIINSEKYYENVKKISKLFKDRPISPLNTAVYWTEYVLRYRGAKHLQSSAIQLNFFQLYLLDVWAVLLFLGYILYKVQKLIFNFVWKWLMRKLTIRIL